MNCMTISPATYQKNKIIIGVVIIVLSLFLESPVDAYELNGKKWPQPSATFYVDISGAEGLWNEAFETAMYLWGVDTNFKFLIVRENYEDPCDSIESGINGVAFGDTDCGDAWGSTTLAICHYWYQGSTMIQTDIIFNKNESWNVYSTPWSSGQFYGVSDFRRVAVHELGHALGLDHEDSGISTIMRTWASETTIPQQDDINGVAAIYGAPCAYSLSPTSQSVLSGGISSSVYVATSSNCSWTASENLSWVTITSGASRTGSGSVYYAVVPNTTVIERSGNIIVAGKTFSITQSAIQQGVTNFVGLPWLSFLLSSSSTALESKSGSKLGVGGSRSQAVPYNSLQTN